VAGLVANERNQPQPPLLTIWYIICTHISTKKIGNPKMGREKLPLDLAQRVASGGKSRTLHQAACARLIGRF
jgi:hypothetical protein